MNFRELNAAYIPDGEFQEKYWEYLTLEGDLDNEENFYKEGILIILLCMTVEYIDPTAGNQTVFGKTQVLKVMAYVERYKAIKDKQQRLKKILLQGLIIAASMTPFDLVNTDGFEHPDLESFILNFRG